VWDHASVPSFPYPSGVTLDMVSFRIACYDFFLSPKKLNIVIFLKRPEIINLWLAVNEAAR